MASTARRFTAVSLILLFASSIVTADEVALTASPTPVTASPAIPILQKPTDAQPTPQILISVSRRIVAPMFERQVTRNTDVNDQILNSRVIAKSETAAEIRLEMVPSTDGAIFDVVFTGESVAKGAAVNQWIRVPNIARTTLSARCRIHFDGTSFRATPAQATAKSKVQVLGMDPSPQGRFRQRTPDRIIERFGWRQTSRTLAQREEIGARKAVERLERYLNEEVAEELAMAEFPKRLRNSLEKVGLSGQNVYVFSTKDAMYLAIHVPQPDQPSLADMQIPVEKFPKLSDDADVVVSVHESAADRLGYRLFAGAILDQTGLTRDGKQLFAGADLPLPVSLLLDDQQPIGVRFSNGELDLRLKSNRLEFAKTMLPGFGLQMRCRLVPVDGGLRTQLVCAPEVTSEGPFQWPSAIKQMIEATLAKKVGGRTLDASFEIKKLGKPSLRPISTQSKDGWLTLGWSRSAPAAIASTEELELVADQLTP